MRKSFALLLLMCGITLASCGGPKQDLEKLRRVDIEHIDADIKENLNLSFTDANGRKLNNEAKDTDSYYDIYIAENYKSSLFIHETDLKVTNSKGEPIINERTKELYVNTLRTYVEPLPNLPDTYPDEISSIMVEVYNEKYGIPSLSFDFEITKDHGYQKKVYSMDQKFLYPATQKLDELKLQVVYMPVYAVRTYKKSTIYKNYFFIPLQYAFVSGDKQIAINEEKENNYELVDKKINNIKVSEVLLHKNDATIALIQRPVEESK